MEHLGLELVYCHIFTFSFYHNHFWNKLAGFLYTDDTVDVGCIYQVLVYNMMNQYQVVADNKINYVVQSITNYELVFFR